MGQKYQSSKRLRFEVNPQSKTRVNPSPDSIQNHSTIPGSTKRSWNVASGSLRLGVRGTKR
jgi:hypothetical protein